MLGYNEAIVAYLNMRFSKTGRKVQKELRAMARKKIESMPSGYIAYQKMGPTLKREFEILIAVGLIMKGEY